MKLEKMLSSMIGELTIANAKLSLVVEEGNAAAQGVSEPFRRGERRHGTLYFIEDAE